MHAETAETIAIQALGFLASEPERLEQFMALTGHSGAELKQLAQSAASLGGILDHILSDEQLLLDFAATAGLDPEDPAKARAALPGFMPPD